MKAKRGFCAVAGHSRARTNVTASGSHWQHTTETVCSIPIIIKIHTYNKFGSWNGSSYSCSNSSNKSHLFCGIYNVD